MEIEKLIRKNILTITPYSSAREEANQEAEVYLDANENPFDSGVNRYPDPYQAAIKRKLSELKEVSPTQIFIGNGSDEVLDLIFRTFCEPKEDNVVSHNPSYGMYPVLASINNVELRKVNLEAEFELSADKMISAADKNTKLFFICSPNNPIGNILNKEEIKKLLQLKNSLIIIDEAYIDFSDSSSWINELDNYENLVVCQTLSKAWGLAGLRVGMCFASEKIINVLNSIKPPYNINELSQQAALKALNEKSKFEDKLKVILAERSKLAMALNDLPNIKKMYSSEANFILVEVENADQLYNFLMNEKVIVRNRSKEYGCKNCLRLTVGSPEENEKLITLLTQYIHNEKSIIHRP